MFAFAVWDAPGAAAAARPRPARRQAALLRRGARRARVRLGDQVAARGPGRAARLERRGARRLPHAALHPGARHDLPRHPQAAAGARARRRARPGAHLGATGTSSSPATATRRREEDYLEELDAHLREVGAAPADQRRAARRVPLRRHRLVDGGRLHGRGQRQAAGHHLGRLRRTQGFDEVGSRRNRRAASRLRVPRADRQPASRGAAAEAGVALRRAVRRLLGRADLLRVEGGARARHGGALGRRRRRALGRLRPAPRRALGAARRAARSGRPRVAGRLARPGAAALGQRGAVAAPPRAESRSGLRAQARLRHVRAGREERSSIPATSADRSAAADRARQLPRRLPRLRVAAIRSIARCTSTSRPTWSTTS